MLLIYYAISNISSTTIVTNTAVHCCLTSKNSSLSGVCTHTLGLSGFSPWTVKLCCQWVLPVRPQPWSVEGTRAGRAGEYLVPGTWYRWRWLSPALPTTCMCFTFTHLTLYLSTTWASSNLDHWHLWDATSRTLQSRSVQDCCLRDLRLLTSPSTPVSVSIFSGLIHIELIFWIQWKLTKSLSVPSAGVHFEESKQNTTF